METIQKILSRIAGVLMILLLFASGLQAREHAIKPVYQGSNPTKESRAVITWDGSEDVYWNNPDNWDSNTVPGSTDDVVIPSGTPNDPVLSQASNGYCHDLTIDAGAILQLDNMNSMGTSFDIYGSITNNGDLYHTSDVMINLLGGSSETFGGTGNYSYNNEWVSFILRSDYGAHYTLTNDILLLQQLELDAGTAFSLDSYNLQVYSFTLNTSGVLNQNSGTLRIAGETIIFNGTFNCNTGTTWFNAGSSIYAATDQTIPSEDYYSLKVNANNGTTATLGNLSGTNVVVENELRIVAPFSDAGTISCYSDILIKGDFVFGEADDYSINLNIGNGKIFGDGSGNFSTNTNSGNLIDIEYTKSNAISGFGNDCNYNFSGTVKYSGTSDQHIIRGTYENLHLTGASVKYLSDSVEVSGDITISSGTFDVRGKKLGIGNSSSDNYGPFYNFYQNNRSQMLYKSAEIGEEGDISHIGFKITSLTEAGYENMNNLSIKLLHTTENSLPSSFVDMSGASEVLSSASYELPNSPGWFTFDIADFPYNGSDNLIIEISWGDNGDWTYDEYNLSRTDYSGGADYLFCYGYSDTETPPAWDGRVKTRPDLLLMGGTSSNNIRIAGDWVNEGNVYFNQSDVVFNGSMPQSADGGGSPFFTLELQNANGLILSGNVEITDSLKFTDGKISTDAYLLSLGSVDNDMVISGACETAYVNASGAGKVKMYHNSQSKDYLFPVGDEAIYSPFTFNPGTSVLTSDAWTSIRVVNAAHPDLVDPTEPHLTRYWEFTPSGISSPDYAVHFVYDPADDVYGSEGMLYPAKYTAAEWTSGVYAANTTEHSLSWSGLTSFSDFTGAGKAALPVELVYYEGKCVDETMELAWQTASECNSAWFVIEKSRNMIDFVAADSIPAAGFSNTNRNYHWVDDAYTTSFPYYRLLMMDTDNSSKYADWISVWCSEMKVEGFELQRISNSYRIEYIGHESGETSFELFSAGGNRILFENRMMEPGDGFFVSMESMNAGIYLLKVSKNDV
ncbi:MAG: hypothetical protein ACQES0_11365, partial [Bacteroidota bacterium]